MHLLAIAAAALAPTRVQTAPHVDGVLDDDTWRAVPASDHFVQSFPHDGDAPTQPTHVQVAYDDDNLYIAIDCVQSVRPVVRLARRDEDIDVSWAWLH